MTRTHIGRVPDRGAPPLREKLSVHNGRQGKGVCRLLSTFNIYRSGGLAARPGSYRRIVGRGHNLRKWGARHACVVVDVWGRGDVEPLVGLAVRLRALGAEVRVCAPPDWADRLAQFGVPLVPIGPPVRALMHGAMPPSVADVPRRAAELIAEQFDKLPVAAEGCDALVATGLFPVAASVQSVAEKLGIRYVFAACCPIFLPSPHRRPTTPPPLPS